jgi:hypothetical protein
MQRLCNAVRRIGARIAIPGLITSVTLVLLCARMCTIVGRNWFLSAGQNGQVSFLYSDSDWSTEWISWPDSGFGWMIGGYREALLDFAWLPTFRRFPGYWFVRIPVLPLTFLCALLFWRAYLPERRRRHRLRYGLCIGCGYDLTGNTSGRCPECGQGMTGNIASLRARSDWRARPPEELTL